METTIFSNKYDWIVFDLVNFCYKTFPKEKGPLAQFSDKFVYSTAAANAIKSIESLKAKYGHNDTKVVLLVDNYLSRADLTSAFVYADRKNLLAEYKRVRRKEDKEFYNTVNIVRYYFLVSPGNYYSVKIDGLEADDLLKPLLDYRIKQDTALLVTSDLDWSRYLSDKVHWLPSLKDAPETREDLSAKLGFDVSEKNIVLYKAIFGDASDNIKGILPLNSPNLEHFIEFARECPYAEYATVLYRNPEWQKRWPASKVFSEQEGQLRINIQIISTIPVAENIFADNYVKSRSSETIHKKLRELLGLSIDKKGFVFGNVKRPRVEQ